MYLEVEDCLFSSEDVFHLSVLDGKIMGRSINGSPMFITNSYVDFIVHGIRERERSYILAIRKEEKTMKMFPVKNIAGILLDKDKCKLRVDLCDDEYLCDVVKIFDNGIEEERENLLQKISDIESSLIELRDLLVRACPDKLMK